MGRVVLSVQSPKDNFGPPLYEPETVETYPRKNNDLNCPAIYFVFGFLFLVCFFLFFSPLVPSSFRPRSRYATPRHTGRTEGSHMLVTVYYYRSILGRNEQEENGWIGGGLEVLCFWGPRWRIIPAPVSCPSGVLFNL